MEARAFFYCYMSEDLESLRRMSTLHCPVIEQRGFFEKILLVVYRVELSMGNPICHEEETSSNQSRRVFFPLVAVNILCA